MGDGPYVFRVSGKVLHRMGTLVPPSGKTPSFAQLYVYDTDIELRNGLDVFGEIGETRDRPDPHVVSALMEMLDEHNVLVRTFRIAAHRVCSPECPNLGIKIVGSESSDPGVYRPPVASELAALIVGDFTAERCKFDIVVQRQDGPMVH